MLEKRKGIGISTILKLTVALMVASLFVSVATLGSLGKALSTGFDNLGKNTDYTVDIDESGQAGRKKLSQTAKYVRQRAGNDGCGEDNGKSWNTVKQQNNAGGYPALSDTFLGRRPECLAGKSGGMRGLKGMAMSLGKDQEGIYSRVGFEVNEEITLNSRHNTWLENRLRGALKGSVQDNTVSSCETDALGAVLRDATGGAVVGGGTGALTGNPVAIAGGAAVGFIGAGAGSAANQLINNPGFVGTGDKFVVFVNTDNPEEMDDRVNKWLEDAENYNYGKRVYCYGGGGDISGIKSTSLSKSPLVKVYRDYYNEDFEITLCPGDMGYIQMNKGKPQNNGEAGEELSGNAKNFPHIVINRKGDCSDPSSSDSSSGSDAISGTVTNDRHRTIIGDGSNNVVEESGSSFSFEPSNSDGPDALSWQPLPEGDKTVTVEVEFSETGHFEIDAQKSSGSYPNSPDTATYVSMDGSSNINIKKPGSSEEDTGVDYETGKTYTFTLERNSDNLIWTIKEDGTEIYSHEGSGSDFRRLEMVSGLESSDLELPSLEVKEVSIEGN